MLPPSSLLIMTLAMVVMSMAAAGLARADDTPEAVRTLCAGCHGVDGNGGNPARPEYPKLAGKRSAYLKKQLLDYQTGKRKSPIMEPLAAALSAEQIDQVSAHYAQQAGRSSTASLE